MDPFLREKFHTMHGATVKRAMALIKPAAGRRDDCSNAVEMAIIDLGYINGQERKPPFKARKRASESLALALLNVEHLSKNNDLPSAVRLFFPHEDIRKWRIELEKEATAKAPVKLSRKAAGTRAPAKASRKAAARSTAQ